MSTPAKAGKEDDPRGFNELRIEDKLGEEEIYVHGEKDMNVYIKNDYKDRILHDRHEHTDHFTYLETMGETHETLHGQRKTELFANENLTVHGTLHYNVGERYLVKAGRKAVYEGAAEVTLKVGANFIKLNPAGIFTSSAVQVGSDSPSPDSANPLLRGESEYVDEGTAPKSVIFLLKAAAKNNSVWCETCSKSKP